MAVSKYACQKDHIVSPEDNDEYWRLIVMEVGPEGTEEVLDITHHNTEELLGAWLRE